MSFMQLQDVIERALIDAGYRDEEWLTDVIFCAADAVAPLISEVSR